MRIETRARFAAPRDSVWDLLASTDRLNRELGLPPVQYTFAPRLHGGTEVRGAIRVGPLTLSYDEEPFEWVRPAWLSERRVFRNGPIRGFAVRVDLEDAPSGGCVARLAAHVEPRSLLWRPVARLAARKLVRDFRSVCAAFDQWLAGRSATPYPRRAGRPPADLGRLAEACARLAADGVSADLVEMLRRHVAEAPAEDLSLLRPFELADRWRRNRFEVLRALLAAASPNVGMLDLRWRTLCPYCRADSSPARRLGELESRVHCQACDIRYDATFDRSVEVCFAVTAAIRPTVTGIHCIGGPGNADHVAAQWIARPGETRHLRPLPPPGGYRLVSVMCDGSADVGLGPDSEGLVVEVTPGDAGRPHLRLGVGGGAGAARLANSASEAVVVRLESRAWVGDAATAALVTSLPEFRYRFGSEVLSPDVEIAVEQVSILFSDLRGSTRMYRERGDAPSYRAVRDYFGWMGAVIGRHAGGVVKTIGDAVMAVFRDPADALSAALDIQREAPAAVPGLRIKLAVHSGPAIAVNANGVLDYFGQTVNLASQLERHSSGGDVVLAEGALRDARTAERAAASWVIAERFVARVPGIDEDLALLRLRVKDVAPAPSEAPALAAESGRS
ncbi:MAG TPA: adenylate/guanylate cyclase domain-containing protein [Chthonomonadales bacterium]|nr:adenylate/guanylate cyclase domain-containing protein [Chthonomonadales bacterium]